MTEISDALATRIGAEMARRDAVPHAMAK
jgi:hypothetical protein